jgi:hypothetical protein
MLHGAATSYALFSVRMKVGFGKFKILYPQFDFRFRLCVNIHLYVYNFIILANTAYILDSWTGNTHVFSTRN